MKRAIVSLIVLLAFVGSSYGQCVPAPVPDNTIVPADTLLPCVVQGVFYTEALSLRMLLDSTNFGAQIDSAVINGITDLPAGLFVTYDRPTPIYTTGELACIEIAGQTIDSAGTYTCAVDLDLLISIGGSTPVWQDVYLPYNITVIAPGDSCVAVGAGSGSGSNMSLSIITNGNQIYCAGGATVLSAQGSGGNGFYSYQWTALNGSAIANPFGRVTLVFPTANDSFVVTVSDGLNTTSDTITVSVGNCGSIQGSVFSDVNGNGSKDANESFLAGIKIKATSTFGTDSTFTRVDGSYSFDAQFNTTYTIIAEPRTRLYCSGTVRATETLSVPGSGTYSTSVTAGNPTATGNNFGLQPPSVPCGTVAGEVFADANNNGTKDVSEVGRSNTRVQLSNGVSTFTSSTGNYQLQLPLNTSIETSIILTSGNILACNSTQSSSIQTFPTSPPTYTNTLTTANPVVTNNDFGVFDTLSIDGGVFNVRGYPVTGGDNFSLWMDWTVIGVNPSPCILRMNFNPSLVNFVSATPPPTRVGPDYVEWSISAVAGSTVNLGCYIMEFVLSNSAAAGSPITFTGSIDCPGDVCASNDTLSSTVMLPVQKQPGTQPDLNQLEVLHTGDQQNGNIDDSDSLFSYIISWQNNTPDSVYSITIIDTLSEFLDVTSLQRPFSSLPFNICVSPDNVLIVEIDDVAVPYSGIDYQRSYGFVQFHIKRKMDIPSGSLIENQATVIFNDQTTFSTNKTSNLYSTTGIAEQHDITNYRLYPNPTTGTMTLEFGEATDAEVQVFSLVGERVATGIVQHDITHQLDLAQLQNGMYLVRVTVNGESKVQKVLLAK